MPSRGQPVLPKFINQLGHHLSREGMRRQIKGSIFSQQSEVKGRIGVGERNLVEAVRLETLKNLQAEKRQDTQRSRPQ